MSGLSCAADFSSMSSGAGAMHDLQRAMRLGDRLHATASVSLPDRAGSSRYLHAASAVPEFKRLINRPVAAGARVAAGAVAAASGADGGVAAPATAVTAAAMRGAAAGAAKRRVPHGSSARGSLSRRGSRQRGRGQDGTVMAVEIDAMSASSAGYEGRQEFSADAMRNHRKPQTDVSSPWNSPGPAGRPSAMPSGRIPTRSERRETMLPRLVPAH